MQPNATSVAERLSLPSYISMVLQRAIENGKFVGQLPPERVLAEQLAIGRSTLRQALLSLEQQGLITSGSGCRRQILQRGKLELHTGNHPIRILTPAPPAMLSQYLNLFCEHLSRLLQRNHLNLQWEVRPLCYGNRPQRALEQLLEDAVASCWILLRSTQQQQLWFGQRKGVNYLVMGHLYPAEGATAPAITTNHTAVCRHAVARYRRHGHQHIALLIASDNAGSDITKKAFFESCLPHCNGILYNHDRTSAGIRKAISVLLRSSPRPTALLTTGGRDSIMALSCLLQAGVRIPQEMELVCRDDDPYFDFVHPGIARYGYSFEKLARRAARLLVRLAAGHSTGTKRLDIMPEYIPGGSVRGETGGVKV